MKSLYQNGSHISHKAPKPPSPIWNEQWSPQQSHCPWSNASLQIDAQARASLSLRPAVCQVVVIGRWMLRLSTSETLPCALLGLLAGFSLLQLHCDLHFAANNALFPQNTAKKASCHFIMKKKVQNDFKNIMKSNKTLNATFQLFLHPAFLCHD